MDILNIEQQKRYNSISGMSTKVWGPKLWDSLFIMVLGAYPPKIDPKNTEHLKTKKAFVEMIYNLQYTLPCSFCRLSFKVFYKQIPINDFTDSRINLAYWLYLMKDKVNKKLICQELDYLTELHKNYRVKKLSKMEYLSSLKKCFTTIPSPEFISVLDKYESYRGLCSKKLKKCLPRN